MIEGRIIKALSGFYYVKSSDDIIECKARGSFRKDGFSPLVGDNVQINITDNNKGIIESIMPRLNFLQRPPVANIDRLFLVVSTAEPVPNTLVIDKIIVSAEVRNIEPIIIINKSDLASAEDLVETYTKVGYKTFCVSALNNEGIKPLKALITDKIVAFCGNSGVGKSSILNAIAPEFDVNTAEISKKLGRGKHTTRHVELFETNGGYIVDTPGFSKLDNQQTDIIKKDNLQFYFHEFEPYLTTCKFTSCSHTKEKGCKIIEAVNDGIICKSRHESYCKLYEQASAIPDWEFDNLK